MLKEVTITPDIGTNSVAFRLVCSCGEFEDKALLHDAKARAVNHIRTKHTKGFIVWQNGSHKEAEKV